MLCFNCGEKILSNDNECPICGMQFVHKCNNCETLNPLLAKFCLNCGLRLNGFDTQVIIKEDGKLLESRKNVAVIFADISGFTALSEQMDPENVREIINDCFDYITRPVYELEGTIDKYIGDCVMILFGAKYIHHNDPERAVTCALKMRSLIEKYSQEKLFSRGIKLELSIGINYGLVVTGSVGNYFDKDYTVLGDVVNSAQRLQVNAGRGEILVSESIYQETKDVINYGDGKEIIVKNRMNSLKCYVPIGFNPDSSKEILIGRERELSTINKWFEYNKYEALTVIGKAGIGKTSLIKSFFSRLEDDIRRVWLDCGGNNQNKVNHTISSVIFNIIGANYDDSNINKRNKLESFSNYLLDNNNHDEIKRNCDFIGLLLGLDRDNDFQNILDSMNFSDINEEIIKQISIFFTKLQKKNRTVIIIDGLHWIDNSSLDILNSLLKNTPELSSLFIFISRYDNEDFKFKNKVLKVENLNRANINELICRKIGCNELNEKLLNSITIVTEGNPLFINELIFSLKNKGQCQIKDGAGYLLIEKIETLPNSIEKLISENLYQLDDKTIDFVERAAVIGKEFSFNWVQNLLTNPIDETSIIKLLIERNIISLSTVHLTEKRVDRIYNFNEDLTREVIYKGILNSKKRDLHKKLGEFIERTYARELENYYETLCLHYEKAGLNDKAKFYYYKNALRYKSNFNLKESLEYYKKYIGDLDSIKIEQGEIEITRALTDIGYIYIILTEHDKALTYLNKALETSSLADDKYTIALMITTIYKEKGMYQKALNILDGMKGKVRTTDSIYGKMLQLKCNILRITGNSEVVHLVKESEEILLQKKDYENLAETMNEAGILYHIKGDIDNSLYYLTKAYEYAEKENNLKVLAKLSGNLGIIYHSSGMISKAIEKINKAISISKSISNMLDYLMAINNLGILYLEMGKFNRSEELFKESFTESKKRSLPFHECISLINLADLMFEKGEEETADLLYTQSNNIASKHNLPIEEAINNIGLAKIQFLIGKYNEGIEILDKTLKIFEEADEVTLISDYYRYKSVFEIQHSDLEKALLYCEKAIEFAMEAKSDYKKLKSIRLKGYVLSEKSDYKNAIALLNESINLSQQLESNYELAKGYYQKFAILYKQGHKNEAYNELLNAKEAIDETDKNRWLPIIEEALKSIKNNSYIFKFYDIS